MTSTVRFPKNSTVHDMASILEDDLQKIENLRLEAIAKLNEFVLRPEFYDEACDLRFDLRDKADDFAVELGGFIAAADVDEPLQFWQESR